MNKNLKAIELDKVLKKLAEETAFKASTEKALELLPVSDIYEVDRLLQELVLRARVPME